MTIKQQGGIFGRNPTFKNVSATDLNVSTLTATTANASTLTTTAAIIDNYVDIKSSGTVRGNIYADASNMYINTQGTNTNLNANGGDVVLGNANLVINTSGKGIDFSATSGTGTSELFDDYEEGEFAVTLTPSTSGSIALQTGADTMLYNKVGRVVHCQGQINVSSIASAVGSSIAVNLPFAKLNTTDSSEASSGPVTYYNTSAYSVLPAYVPSSATQAFNIVIDPSTLANGHRFYIQFSYTAA